MSLANTAATGAPPTAEQIDQVQAALPERARAKPEKPRKMLVFTLCRGYAHSSIELGAETMRLLGERTGAFETTISADPGEFAPEKLGKYDAVCFMSTTGELFEDEALRRSFMDFVKSGKGVVGIHAATDCFYKWPEFGEMMGGYFDGHPWTANMTVTLENCEPKHPLCAAFEGKDLTITDEIYQIKAPYSRSALRVLTRLNTNKTNMKLNGINRTDGDFAVSWIREFGKGRVFYCSLGHREDVFWNPVVLKHYLDGIQYALGDLKADATPSAVVALKSEGWRPLFNGKDLSGWQGLVGDPVKRAAMSADELAKAQRAADELMRAHWKVVDGLLQTDGAGANLCTTKDFGDFELRLDWKIGPDGDSGVYLRGSPQVQIWDPAEHPEGSGGLYNNQKGAKDPAKCADRPIGEWNTFEIKMVGEKVWVHLNGELVVDGVTMENYWEREKAIYPTGSIELQAHHSPLWFRDIYVRPISGGKTARIRAVD